MDRQLAPYGGLLALLEELLLEIQYRCDTGNNLELSSSPLRSEGVLRICGRF